MDARPRNYAGVFEGRIPFGKAPALLVIDVVQAYLEPGSALYAPAFATALNSIVRLVDHARQARMPIIFTNVLYQAGGADGGLFYRKVAALQAFDRGSPLGRFPDDLQPRADEIVVTKQYASAFFGTSLAATLTASGIDTLLLAGFSTSGCVRASALDALQHGFRPFVVRDGCGDRDPAPHESNLVDLQAKYAEVIGESDAVALIAGAR